MVDEDIFKKKSNHENYNLSDTGDKYDIDDKLIITNKYEKNLSNQNSAYVYYRRTITRYTITNADNSINTVTEMPPICPNFYLFKKSNLDIICDHIDHAIGNNTDKERLIRHLKLDGINNGERTIGDIYNMMILSLTFEYSDE